MKRAGDSAKRYPGIRGDELRRAMRNYCRVFHTSMDYLTSMPMTALLEELEDAVDELMEEQEERERQMKRQRNSARRSGR